MKKLKNLKGAKMLTRNEQQEIKGGIPIFIPNGPCGPTGGVNTGPVAPDEFCGGQRYNGDCWYCY